MVSGAADVVSTGGVIGVSVNVCDGVGLADAVVATGVGVGVRLAVRVGVALFVVRLGDGFAVVGLGLAVVGFGAGATTFTCPVMKLWCSVQ